jgi:hypothetical protein
MSKDVRFLVECLSNDLVAMLMSTYGWDTKKSMDVLYNSQTYSMLENPLSGLYYQGAVYVFTYLQEEIERGKVNS